MNETRQYDDRPTADPSVTRATVPAGEGGSAGSLPAGGFDLLGEIGRGGMGVVYRARDLALDREVAVKLLQDRYAPDSGTARRFVDEARITSQLQHPGIPPVYQVGTWADGRPFLAMKLIKGHTLDELLKANAPLDPLGVFEGICQAVGFAHAHGVIHRDLKPANVMVGAFAEVQVMDWGLAKVLQSSTPADRAAGGEGSEPNPDPAASPAIRTGRVSDGTFTQYGSVLGTPAYMSPEQAAGETDKIDRRSDVFGLGAILCVLLTGKPPFRGSDVDSVRLNAVRGRTEDAFARLDASGADPGVIALCKGCLAFDRDRRPADAVRVAHEVADLRRASEERAKAAEVNRAKAEVAVGEQRKRRRVILWAAAALGLVLATGLVVSVSQWKRASDEATNARVAEAEAGRQLVAANDAYALSREALVEVGTDLPEVLRQAVYTRDARLKADEILADALAKQLDPVAVRGLSGRAKLSLHLRLGDVYTELGKAKAAEEQYRAAFDLSSQLLTVADDEPGLAKGNHALTLVKLAVAERDGKRTVDAATAALERLAEAEKLQRELLADPPPTRTPAELRQSLANCLLEVATTRRMLQQNEQALAPCREAVELLRPQPDDPPANRYTRGRKLKLAQALSQLGKIHTARQDDPASEHALKEAESVAADTLKDDPKNPLARLTAARAAREYGDFLLMRNRFDEAATVYAQDLGTFRELLGTPELNALKFELGDAYYRAATLALKRKDPKSTELYTRCRNLWAEVTEVNPTPSNKLALGLAHARLGDHTTAAAAARKVLAEPGFTPGQGIQAVSVLALCGGAANGGERETYFADAVAGLTVLVDKMGYKNISRLKTDPDLDPIRDNPAFQTVIKRLETPPAPEK